jgi:predicted MFS family arabinose efflux permease
MVAQIRVTEPHKGRVHLMFRALSNRNYRIFWIGTLLSNIGSWMQAVAQGWLVLQLTNSPFWLGFDGFITTVPGLLLPLIGGVIADQMDRRVLMLYTQAIAGLNALVLGILIATGTVELWMVLLLSFITGCTMAISSPAYQAMTVDYAGREHMANAIALNATQFQFGRVIGPTFAGFAMTAFGLAGCFFANAFSYVAVVWALMKLKGEPEDKLKKASVGLVRKLWGNLVEGFRYVLKRPRVFTLLSISATINLFGVPYITFLPVIARDRLGMGEKGFALMMGVAGLGAFLGALFLAFSSDFRRKGLYLIFSALAFALCLIGFSLERSPVLSMLLLTGVGFSIVNSIATVNTLLQQLVIDQMRGRVMSLFVLSTLGTMPIGNLTAGIAASNFGAPATLAVGGVIIFLYVSIIAATNKRLREL